jgi:hypothetical protein
LELLQQRRAVAVAVARANPRVRPFRSLSPAARGSSAERKTPPHHHWLLPIPSPHPSPRKRPPRRDRVLGARRQCRQAEEESPGSNREGAASEHSSSAEKNFWNNFSSLWLREVPVLARSPELRSSPVGEAGARSPLSGSFRGAVGWSRTRRQRAAGPTPAPDWKVRLPSGPTSSA